MIKRFNENFGLNFNELLIDPFGDGTESITQDAVYLEKGDDWQNGDGQRYNQWYLYLGPVEDGDCLSDNISFTDEFLNSVIGGAGCRNYELHAAENLHKLYFDNDADADEFYTELESIIKSYGLRIYN